MTVELCPCIAVDPEDDQTLAEVGGFCRCGHDAHADHDDDGNCQVPLHPEARLRQQAGHWLSEAKPYRPASPR